MKRGLILFILLLIGLIGRSQTIQDTLKGSVSYKTSQNIYVKFESTREIEVGDTLYGLQQGALQPVLVVHQLSTTTCVGGKINNTEINLADPIFSLQDKPTPVETPVTS